MILKMFKNNMNFITAAYWVNSKISNRKINPHPWYSYAVTNVGHYHAAIIEGL